MLMDIFYENTNITSQVQVKEVSVIDTCGGHCDSIEIVFENADGWFRWGPKEDDRLIVALDGYDSGIMYVNTVVPEDGCFRILATSLPCKARTKSYRSFEGKTIDEIMGICAAASGMEYQIFGIDKNIIIPYVEQANETCAAFLHKLLIMEGAALKCVNGKYTAIGIEYAQNRAALKTVTIAANSSGVRYIRSGQPVREVQIITPYAKASAIDTSVDTDKEVRIISNLPVKDDMQASRWAKYKLMHINSEYEYISFSTAFDPGITAMIRINVVSETDIAGEWLVQNVTHDLIDKNTTIELCRCIRTIA